MMFDFSRKIMVELELNLIIKGMLYIGRILVLELEIGRIWVFVNVGFGPKKIMHVVIKPKRYWSVGFGPNLYMLDKSRKFGA